MESITLEVMGAASGSARCAIVAAAAAAEPDGARAGRRRVDAASQLRGDRALAAERARWCSTSPSSSTVPLRERNELLLAAGYAPVYRAARAGRAGARRRSRGALDRLLEAHEPFPALVVDRQWELVAANAALAPLLEGVAPHLLEPPVNTLRVALHPEGMAPRIENLRRVARAPAARPGPRARTPPATRRCSTLYDELEAYPGPDGEPRPRHLRAAALRRPDVPQHADDVRRRRRRHRLRAVDRGVLPGRRAHGGGASGLLVGDQPRAAAVGEEAPDPAQEDDQPVLEARSGTRGGSPATSPRPGSPRA